MKQTSHAAIVIMKIRPAQYIVSIAAKSWRRKRQNLPSGILYRYPGWARQGRRAPPLRWLLWQDLQLKSSQRNWGNHTEIPNTPVSRSFRWMTERCTVRSAGKRTPAASARDAALNQIKGWSTHIRGVMAQDHDSPDSFSGIKIQEDEPIVIDESIYN